MVADILLFGIAKKSKQFITKTARRGMILMGFSMTRPLFYFCFLLFQIQVNINYCCCLLYILFLFINSIHIVFLKNFCSFLTHMGWYQNDNNFILQVITFYSFWFRFHFSVFFPPSLVDLINCLWIFWNFHIFYEFVWLRNLWKLMEGSFKVFGILKSWN